MVAGLRLALQIVAGALIADIAARWVAATGRLGSSRLASRKAWPEPLEKMSRSP